MPKLATQKTVKELANLKPGVKPYTVGDGNGLFLVVSPQGRKSWLFRYRFEGKQSAIPLGEFSDKDVKSFRDRARELSEKVRSGTNPRAEILEAKAATAQAEEEAEAERVRNATTFEKIAGEWYGRTMDQRTPGYSLDTWRRLEKNVFPFIGARPIFDLRAPDILAPLRLVEERGARESAHRILSVCSQIFRYAVAAGILESDPARDLRGALSKPVERHFAALTEPQRVGDLMRAISGYNGDTPTRVAMRLGVLTFVRPGNLRMAEWSEFHNLDDPDRAEWRIPGEKMKVRTKRAFVVPLAPQALAVIEQVRPLTASRSRYLFPSAFSDDRPMSNNTVNLAFRRLGYTKEDMTGHGVRAMARTLCHEVLGFAPEVLEEQLAHGKSGPLRDAYDRTTHMTERRRLMREWADYLDILVAGEVRG